MPHGDHRRGNEPAVYGLITTVHTLVSPFSIVLIKNMDANFDVSSADLVVDNIHVRTCYIRLAAYGFKLFSLVFVLLLPRQMVETPKLKRMGGKSKFFSILTIAYLIFTFC